MDLGQLVFWLASAAAWAYLSNVRRPIDVFTVAALAGTLFFLPAYFGVVSRPPLYPTRPIEPVLYLSFAGYMLVTLMSALLADRLWARRNEYRRRQWIVAEGSPSPVIVIGLAALWGSSLAIAVATHGAAFFQGSKAAVMTADSGIRQVFDWLSPLLAICLFLGPNRAGKLSAVLVLLITLIVGSRSAAAMTAIALLLVYGRRIGPISVARKYTVLAPVLVVAAVFIGAILKPLYGGFRVKGIQGVVAIASAESPVELAARGAEFLGTQYIFNEIALTAFSTDGGHVLRGPLSFLPLPRRLYTTPSSEFNDLFQPVLFQEKRGGMAYNPFGEAYAAAGVLGIVALLSLMAVTLVMLHRALYSRRLRQYVPLVALIAAIIVFYGHRTSFAASFGLVRNVFWPYIGCMLLAWLIRGATRGQRSSGKLTGTDGFLTPSHSAGPLLTGSVLRITDT